MSPPVMPELDRESWREIARNARAALEADPNDTEAREWFERASGALRETLPEVEAQAAEASRGYREEARPDFSGLGGAIGAAALKAGQGATFGISDELAGLVAGAGSKVRGKGFEEGYRGGVTGAREALTGASSQRPVVSGVSDLAASLLIPVPGAGAARRAQTTGRALISTLARPRGQQSILKAALASREGLRPALKELVKGGATIGGTQGAAHAAGRSEGGLRERGTAALVGGTVGGATGGLAPLAATGGRVALRQLKNALGYVGRPVLEPLRLLRGGDTPIDDILQSSQRVADEALDAPTFLRRNLGSTRLPEGFQAVRSPGERLQRMPRVSTDESLVEEAILRSPVQRARRSAPTASVVKPSSARGEAIAAAKVGEQIRRGERGPAGGALVGAKARVQAQRIEALARRLAELPDDALQRELDNPLVDDLVKAAARKELVRRSASAVAP